MDIMSHGIGCAVYSTQLLPIFHRKCWQFDLYCRDREKLVILYHRTPNPDQLLAEGFCDTEGTYFMTSWHHGVFLSDQPLGINEGARSGCVIAVDIPESEIAQFEWAQEDATYREWRVPADLLNRYPRRLLSEEEVEELERERCGS